MAHSESINEIAAALSKAQGVMKPAAKSVENTFFKSSYADLAAIAEACRQALSANGLAVTQMTNVSDDGKVSIETLLMHSSGQWISAHYPVNPVKNDPQGLGSAITYARRYSLAAIVGVVADDEDDDGNAASDIRVPARKQAATPPPAPKAALTPAEGAKEWAKCAIAKVKGFTDGDAQALCDWYTADVKSAIKRLAEHDKVLQNTLVDEICKAEDRTGLVAA